MPVLLATRFADLGSKIHYLGFGAGFVAIAIVMLAMPRAPFKAEILSEPLGPAIKVGALMELSVGC